MCIELIGRAEICFSWKLKVVTKKVVAFAHTIADYQYLFISTLFIFRKFLIPRF